MPYFGEREIEIYQGAVSNNERIFIILLNYEFHSCANCLVTILVIKFYLF